MRKFLELVVLASIGAALTAAPALAALPSGNLLANPEAEAPPVRAADGSFGAPQGWVATVTPEDGEQGPFDSCYGGADGETEALERSVGAAIEGGARYFFAGFDKQATLRQDVTVPAEAGGRTLVIGGDFGGWESQEDHATLEARFLDAGGSVELGAPLATGAVTAADRGFATTMLPRQASGTVPIGTATIRFVLTQTREEGLSNDGYADNLYATFDAAAPARPAPTGDAACPLAAAPVTPPPVVPQPAPPAPAPAAPVAPLVRITRGPAHETPSPPPSSTSSGPPAGATNARSTAGRGSPARVGATSARRGPATTASRCGRS